MEEEFSVRVRAGPPTAARLLPSERRYSASTALGLALVHLALALLAALLLAALWRPAPAPHEATAVLAAAAALAVAALLPGAAGLLAWHRWYEDRNIRWLLGAAVVSAAGALASLATTSAALATAHERWSVHRLGTGAGGVLLLEGAPHRSPAGGRRGGAPVPALPPVPAMPTAPAQEPLNATWPGPDTVTTAAGAGAGTNESQGPAYETASSALNGSPAPTESDSTPHVFLFPGVHSPVDPEDENGTFQNIWKHLSGDVGLPQSPNSEPKLETDERVGTTTVEAIDTRFDASEYAHDQSHSPHEHEHDLPPTESYYHSDDYEMESDESFPDWQHDVRIVPTDIPPIHVSYSPDREEHANGEHATGEHAVGEHAVREEQIGGEELAYGEEHAHVDEHSGGHENGEEAGDGEEHAGVNDDRLPSEHEPDVPHEEASPGKSSSQPAHQRRRREDAGSVEDPSDEEGFPPASRFWDPRATMSFVLSLNLIVAAVAEFAWSLWTLLFAWRGARSGYPGDEERRSPSVTPQPLAAASAHAHAHAPPGPKHAPGAHAHAPAHAHSHASHLHKLRRPDIISNHQQKDPILQETTMPYQERVRRFLASEAPSSAETQIE